jgi:negative regulator of flagellin synthesis FlgM
LIVVLILAKALKEVVEMIISNNQIQNMLTKYFKQEAKASSANDEELRKSFKENYDKVTVSQDAQAFSNAKDVIKEMPEIREDRTAPIQKKVEFGNYEITDEEVAEKMIGRSLVDKLV